MEFGVLLRLVGFMKLILILSCPFNIQGRGPYLSDFVGKKLVSQVFDFSYKCDHDQGHQTDLKMYSLLVPITTPSLKEICQ